MTHPAIIVQRLTMNRPEHNLLHEAMLLELAASAQ